jgi:hypothetical protein
MYFNNIKAFNNFPCHIYALPWRQSGKDWKHFTNITANKQMTYSWFQTFAVFWILYSFFWVIPWHLNFMCRCFRTLCQFHLHRMELTECSETSAHKMQMLGNHPKERMQITYYILKFTLMFFHSLMLNPCILKEIVLLYETREVSSIPFSRSHCMIVGHWWHEVHWPASYFGCVLVTSCWNFSCIYICV